MQRYCLTEWPDYRSGSVARSLRVEYPGAYYHLMARGNRREDIFLDEDDPGVFLEGRVGSLCPDGVAGARVGADEQSLPSVHRDLGGQPPEGIRAMLALPGDAMKSEWRH